MPLYLPRSFRASAQCESITNPLKITSPIYSNHLFSSPSLLSTRATPTINTFFLTFFASYYPDSHVLSKYNRNTNRFSYTISRVNWPWIGIFPSILLPPVAWNALYPPNYSPTLRVFPQCARLTLELVFSQRPELRWTGLGLLLVLCDRKQDGQGR